MALWCLQVVVVVVVVISTRSAVVMLVGLVVSGRIPKDCEFLSRAYLLGCVVS